MDEELDPQIEQQARDMGWRPQEEWKGNPDKWVDAQEFVERGEQILPILRANNRRLNDDLLTMRQNNDRLSQELEATRSIVQNLEKHFTESTERQLAEQRKALKAELRDAVEDRDVDRELEVREQLDQLTEAEREAKKKQQENKEKLSKTPPKGGKTDPDIDPDFETWKKENPWFGEDRKRTKAVIRAAEDLREDGDTSTGIEFYNKALEMAEGAKKSDERTPVDKVGTGSHRGGGDAGPKGWASLPAEAKAACMEDAENFVGEGKLCKNLDEWKKYYVNSYYGS